MEAGHFIYKVSVKEVDLKKKIGSVVAAYIPYDIQALIQKEAEEKDQSKSNVVTKALKEHFRNKNLKMQGIKAA